MIEVGKDRVSQQALQRVFKIEAAWTLANLASGSDEDGLLLIWGLNDRNH